MVQVREAKKVELGSKGQEQGEERNKRKRIGGASKGEIHKVGKEMGEDWIKGRRKGGDEASTAFGRF